MESPFRSSHASLVRLGSARYPVAAPFHPGSFHPEYRWGPDNVAAESNAVYDGVRSALQLLDLDAGAFGTPAWNPLGALVRPGETVLIKPNLICQANWEHPDRWEEVVTHPSVVRAVVDYALIALDGRGRIVIADGPQTDSDLDALLTRSGLAELLRFYRNAGAPVELLDLRRDRWFTKGGVTERREQLPGDPLGYVSIDLAGDSAFHDYALSGRFYGADYDIEETARFHSGGRHEYVLCQSVLAADLFINLPKLKTHKKTGVTLSLKNLVGINGYRNCLPHHTLGSPQEGGDEFPDSGLKRNLESGSIQTFKRVLTRLGGAGGPAARAVKRLGTAFFGDSGRVVRSGNWHGNDTCWRMVLDLNRCLIWHDRSGQRLTTPRRYLSLIDGVIGGEGNGPLAPQPVPSAFLVAGFNPWAVDWVATEEMGLPPERVPLLQRPLDRRDRFDWLLPEGAPTPRSWGARRSDWRPFRPHFGWQTLQTERHDPVSR